MRLAGLRRRKAPAATGEVPRRGRWIVSLILLGLAAYLLALGITLPAPLAHDWVRDRGWLPEGLHLHGVTGSLWSGRAQEARWEDLTLQGVTWRVHPWDLLRGALGVEAGFSGPAPGGSAHLRLQPGGIGIRDLRLDLPAAPVAGALVDWPVVVEGRIVADIPGLALDRDGRFHDVTGTVAWLNAASGYPEPLPLGDLHARLGDEDGALTADARDRGGPLFLQASARLEPDGRYRLRARLGTRPQAGAALDDALSLIGRPDRGGRIPLNLDGRL
ncbi:type II secretion system protein N [Ectothiorhodospira mobilis]|uniref:type II secretion system protein N n=1 Tax=Ectothiorhodospira mobilis TaxID=195064 RepID=UPI00190797CE|nr:type II secretion system protein N [Ectothiorhodospira mobilis]